MPDNRSIEERVKQVVMEHLGPTNYTPETTFNEMGADSLDEIELVMSTEEEFGVEIPDHAAEKIKSPKEAIDYLKTIIT